jgi:hypothetical protein
MPSLVERLVTRSDFLVKSVVVSGHLLSRPQCADREVLDLLSERFGIVDDVPNLVIGLLRIFRVNQPSTAIPLDPVLERATIGGDYWQARQPRLTQGMGEGLRRDREQSGERRSNPFHETEPIVAVVVAMMNAEILVFVASSANEMELQATVNVVFLDGFEEIAALVIIQISGNDYPDWTMQRRDWDPVFLLPQGTAVFDEVKSVRDLWESRAVDLSG